jgi:diguanylate cyclase (GGDEF)-like protein
MDVTPLQAKFIRSYWTLLLASLAATSLVFVVTQRSVVTVRTVLTYLAMVVLAIACRLAARFSRRWAITAAALGTIPFAAALLYAPEVRAVLEVGAVGRASFAAPSTLLMGALWGWPGALITVVLAVCALGAGGSVAELLSAMTLLTFVGFSGAAMGKLIHTLERTNARLGEAASRDPMTGLMNRRALESLPELHGQWLLTTWDVDGLKRVNDVHGHAAGDAYLLEFVRALESATAAEDRLYRMGGDEFVGLHEDFSDASALESRVRRNFPQVSMGSALVRSGDLHAAMLEADRALYAVKAAHHAERRVLPGRSTLHQEPAV